jgi:tetratricopeptide (TPR) repeat protein
MTALMTRRIDGAMEKEDWETARRLLLEELEQAPEDHWLTTRLATTFYEQQDYAAALKWSEKALTLAPECPLVLWDYASALDMTGQEEAAVQVWRDLIDRGPARIADDECGEGLRWAESLVNDSRYRAALSSYDLGKKKDALRLLREHLAHRKPGLPSLYSLREVRAKERQMLGRKEMASPRPRLAEGRAS